MDMCSHHIGTAERAQKSTATTALSIPAYDIVGSKLTTTSQHLRNFTEISAQSNRCQCRRRHNAGCPANKICWQLVLKVAAECLVSSYYSQSSTLPVHTRNHHSANMSLNTTEQHNFPMNDSQRITIISLPIFLFSYGWHALNQLR